MTNLQVRYITVLTELERLSLIPRQKYHEKPLLAIAPPPLAIAHPPPPPPPKTQTHTTTVFKRLITNMPANDPTNYNSNYSTGGNANNTSLILGTPKNERIERSIGFQSCTSTCPVHQRELRESLYRTTYHDYKVNSTDLNASYRGGEYRAIQGSPCKYVYGSTG